ITVTGTGSINLAGKLLVICGNVVYDGLELSGNDAAAVNAFFAPNGASITVKNATVGEKRANVIGSKIVVESGTFNIVAGNIRDTGYSVAGADITVTGGTISKVLGGSYDYNKAISENGDAITGASTVVIGTQGASTGPSIGDLVGGSWYAASTYKGATVTIYSGTITDLVVCGVGYMSATAKELNALYTVNWNGGTVSGRWCAASLTDDHPDDKSIWVNAVINLNTSATSTGFTGAAKRSVDSTARKMHVAGNVTLNVASGVTLKNLYNGSYLEGGGSTDVDITVNVAKGATLGGVFYCASNIGSANCVESGDSYINLGTGSGTAKVTVKDVIYLGAYLGGKSTGSTLGGKTTFVANNLDLVTNSKILYAGSNNQAAAASNGGSGVEDAREIDCTINNSEFTTAYLGSNLGNKTTYKAAKRTAHAVVKITGCTFTGNLVCGSYMEGQYGKDHGSLVATIKDTNITGKFIGGCEFKYSFLEQAGTRTLTLENVDVTGEFYGAGVYNTYGSNATTHSKRVGTTTLNIKNVTTRNSVTLFGSRSDANFFTDDGVVNVVVDGLTTTVATNIYCAGYNGRNNTDCVNKYLLDMTVELKNIEAGDTYWVGIGGYNKGSVTEGESGNSANRTIIVDKQSSSVVNNLSSVKIASKLSKYYASDEYIIKDNGAAIAKVSGEYATLKAALDAVNAKTITVSENDFSIVGTSIRTGNLAMRCRVKVSKNNTLNIKRMGILVGLDNTTPFEFDILTNKPAQNNVKDANSADAQNGMITDDKNYPNHNLFAAAITGYEASGVLNSDRAKTNVYFRGYIVVEDGGFTKVIYTTPEGPDVNYGKSLVQTAAQLKGGEWYAALAPANKTKVDELAALYTA
ncbi:MAG: hypothetical protein IKU45_02135, partial [Clostridia bacterium]|nr:hypothetical protein [Clostridia bacterium]